MKKLMKKLRPIVESIIIVVAGGLLIHLINNWLGEDEPKVENVIFLIGDGMGVAQITATQIAQDYEPLNMERAEYVGLCKTYSTSSRITDSAAAGTALATGHKTRNGMIGMAPDSTALPSIREKAEKAGMPTGIVVTYPVTNATPATFVAHVPHRNMEDEIATYYIKNNVDVIIGGGSVRFDQRADSLNLFDTLRERGYTIATDLTDVEDVTEGKLIVLANEGSLSSILDGRSEEFLPSATEKALEVLTNNAKANKTGFFLMVEGSQIDGWSHQHNVEGVITETKDFDNVVKVAFDYADEHPGTLVVVTADHSTGGLTIVNGNRKFDIKDHKVDYAWTTGGHTGEMVPIFAYGTGAENFAGVFENYELPRIMCRLLGLEE